MLLILAALILVSFFGFILRNQIKNHKKNSKGNLTVKQNSLTAHYIYCFALWFLIICLAIIFAPLSFVYAIFLKLILLALAAFTSFYFVRKLQRQNFNAKNHLEKSLRLLFSVTAAVGIVITILIIFSIVFEAFRFFQMINFFDFFFGLEWNPQTAMRTDQGIANAAFGIVPVFLGTLLITVIAITVSAPIGIMSAIYLSEYVKPRTRNIFKPIIEILAGVPTVVYGYFAVIAIAPMFKTVFSAMGFSIASESALAAGFVMGVMIIPFVLSLTDDALNSVPSSLKDSALALGSTKSEMIRKVAINTAMPSIVGAVMLAISRAIGETMIVTMAAGLIAKLTFNPLDSVTTATAQIVTLLVGDQEFDSPKTLAAFALALVLFLLTLAFNIVALVTVKKYKKKYA